MAKNQQGSVTGGDNPVIDAEAKAAIDASGILEPSKISETALPSLGELHQRVIALETSMTTAATVTQRLLDSVSDLRINLEKIHDAVSRDATSPEEPSRDAIQPGTVHEEIAKLGVAVRHILATNFRNIDIDKLFADHVARHENDGNDVLDDRAIGRS